MENNKPAINPSFVMVNYNNRTVKAVIHDLLVKYGKTEIEYITDQCISEIEKDSYDEINRIAIESKLIIEQFQKLLGVYTTTEALSKIAVLMREDEAENLSFEFIRKVRDGEHHHADHPDEPCRCNEIAAAEFLKNWSGV